MLKLTAKANGGEAAVWAAVGDLMVGGLSVSLENQRERGRARSRAPSDSSRQFLSLISLICKSELWVLVHQYKHLEEEEEEERLFLLF